MIIYVDLDNTLCTTIGTDYANSKPIFERIEIINKLFKNHSITIYTARGSGSGIDHSDLTKNQLEKWGVKYHKLSVGEKPVFDLLIDDKAMSEFNFFNEKKWLDL